MTGDDFKHGRAAADQSPNREDAKLLSKEARRQLDALLAAAEDAASRSGGAARGLTGLIEARAEREGPGSTYYVYQVGPKDRPRTVVLRDVPELNSMLPDFTLSAEDLPSFLSKGTKRAAASNRETPPAGDVAPPAKPGAGSRGSGED